jgi:hypothetical protein
MFTDKLWGWKKLRISKSNGRLAGYKALGCKIEKPNPNQTQDKIYHG